MLRGAVGAYGDDGPNPTANHALRPASDERYPAMRIRMLITVSER